jgi:DNA invertase Pin-like site-specific DNA recombinase
MKKAAAIYVRVSTPDQHVGKKARRPGLDLLMADARRKKFSVVLVAAFDRIARSTRNFLQVIDELDSMGIEFISRRENVDTSGPMGRLFVTIISAIAELERSLVVDRVKSGMRRARLEGRQIGRARLDVNREQVVQDRRSGLSLTQVAKKHGISWGVGVQADERGHPPIRMPQFPPLPGTCRSKPARRVPLNEGGADRNGGKGLYSRPWHATMPDLRLRIAANASCESCKNPMLST